ncbi:MULTISPECIES: rhomboid family intramembrane serine protease [Nocardioides]|uniref:Rhomboid family intramembrane serine protease n=1 Tax=Nocardioides vastitatis TaxID=2568655 RepID=A0ABW0ZB31_9ACTN|nr:rhomboid family intramembrane serine protease [Nocardioides sp.]THJ06738.1 rhomboid family intramembrane serine protease [Nocardioides sp.]
MRRAWRQIPGWQGAAVGAIAFVALLWLVEMVDVLVAHRLDHEGIRPRSDEGLLGILFAPLLHGGWGHLVANSVPVLVLGFLTLATGIARGLAATALIWLLGGLGVWLVAGSSSIHIGASGLVFGWITYLAVRGIVNLNLVQIGVGVLVLLGYGGVLWGVLPGQPGISWQGHLFGAVAGVVAAVALRDSRWTRSRWTRSRSPVV